MKVLFLGDIVGTPGMNLVRSGVPKLRERERLDAVIANAENAANGSGLTVNMYKQLRAAGIDAITLGDHIYKKFDIAEVLNDARQPIVKPANYPAAAAGRDHCLIEIHGISMAVISIMGRTYMKPVDCPYAALDRVLTALPAETKIIIVDVHAEATGEKYLIAHHLAGRVSAVLGTHTHVPTADEQLLNGTAFQCDVGMCGPYASVLGRQVEKVLRTARTAEPQPFDVATGDVRLSGAIVEIDIASGHALSIRRVMWTEADLK